MTVVMMTKTTVILCWRVGDEGVGDDNVGAEYVDNDDSNNKKNDDNEYQRQLQQWR